MGSDEISYCKLPCIDLSKPGLDPGTSEWDSARDQVKQALAKYGCFEASFKRVGSDTQKSMLASMKELFDLPREIKLRNSSEKCFPGYLGELSEVPLFESMAVEEATIYQHVESFVNVFWPLGNPNLCQKLHRFVEQASELDKTVRRMVLESLGAENYMKEHMESSMCRFRMNKYKGPQTTETKQLGLVTHTDKGFITVLYHRQVDGLQVQIKDGRWINVQRNLPDSFIVLCGDSLHAWTNGRLRSPPHRVMMTGDEARYSVGLFSTPKGGYIVKSPEEFVDEQHPLLFKPYDFAEFMKFCLSNVGQTAESSLKAYCGL